MPRERTVMVDATPEDRAIYVKGYTAGKNKYWPAHLPPMPPAPVTALILKAAKQLRDVAADLLSKMDEGDEPKLEAAVQGVDEAFTAMSAWLIANDENERTGAS